MINKHFFKSYLAMLAMLVGLMGCDGSLKQVKSTDSLSTNNNEPDREVQKQPTIYLLVGFAGLGDSGTLPENWLEQIKGMIEVATAGQSIKPQILQLLIQRCSENNTIEGHAAEANDQILNYLLDQGIEDFIKVNIQVIMVGESYGGLVAIQAGLSKFNDTGISTAGLITIRTPYEGVPLARAMVKVSPYLEKFLPYYPDLTMFTNAWQALETLTTTSRFITNLKNVGLSSLDFPILALAGQDKEPTYPYNLLTTPNPVSLMVNGIVEELPQLLEPYKDGNDGLIPTSSATAANSTRGAKFESHELNDFPHIGNTTNHVQALAHVMDFIHKIVR